MENSPQAIAAIANNGRVRVTFYEETVKPLPVVPPTWGTTTTIVPDGGWQWFSGSSLTNGIDYSNINSTTNTCYFSNTSGELNISAQASSGRKLSRSKSLLSNSIETGRTEMGSHSNQSFNTTSGDFNSWPTVTVEWQILPESQKPVEVDKIRSYCTSCGTRVRASSWKFCPSCGEKF